MRRIEITAHCLSPLHHGAFSMYDSGNIVGFRRVPVVMPTGEIRQVPCVAGNSLRGRIRRVLMRGLLEWADIRHLLCDEGNELAYQHLYAALVNGGHLKGSIKRVDPEATRALREQLPALSALGSALFDRLLAGRCDVRTLWPVCEETVATGSVQAPEGYTLSPADDLIVEWSHVRHIDDDHHDPEVTGVTPMPVTMEALAPGTRLQSAVICRGSDLEASAIAWALDRVDTIGGGSAKGLGELRVEHNGNAASYQEWLDSRREQVRILLADMACAFVGKTRTAEPDKAASDPKPLGLF